MDVKREREREMWAHRSLVLIVGVLPLKILENGLNLGKVMLGALTTLRRTIAVLVGLFLDLAWLECRLGCGYGRPRGSDLARQNGRRSGTGTDELFGRGSVGCKQRATRASGWGGASGWAGSLEQPSEGILRMMSETVG